MRPDRCHRESQSIAARDLAEVVTVARCPCCRTPLIARMGRRGPYFHCQCVGVIPMHEQNLTRLRHQQG